MTRLDAGIGNLPQTPSIYFIAVINMNSPYLGKKVRISHLGQIKRALKAGALDDVDRQMRLEDPVR
jgi:hypothetical protein